MTPYGALGRSEECRDLRCRQPFDIAQCNRGALLFRQLTQRHLHPLPPLPNLGQLGGPGAAVDNLRREVNLELCFDLAGRPMGGGAYWRKLISRNGETELAATLRRQDLLDLGLTLAEKVAIVGPCDVDVIDRDGELFLIEFNMRFGGGYPVSQLAGAGFPELLVRAQRGKRLLCEPISRGMFS